VGRERVPPQPARAVELHEEAAAEYDAAFDWYLQRSPDAAQNLDAEFERALAEIAQVPQRWASEFSLRCALSSIQVSGWCELPPRSGCFRRPALVTPEGRAEIG